MKNLLLFSCLLMSLLVKSQSLQQKLATALSKLESDEQFRNAVIGMYVADGRTAKTVFEHNCQAGLAPASCQKIVISAAAFDLLGKDYRYQTDVSLFKSTDSFRLFINGSGDPTLGSWRWPQTGMKQILASIQAALKENNIKIMGCDITVMENDLSDQPIPDGWIWEDIGNYYGAGCRAFNWNENKYDLVLRSGSHEGAPTEIIGFVPQGAAFPLSNHITTGKPNSGDNAYIYSTPLAGIGYTSGTIPPGKSAFIISGSIPDPAGAFTHDLKLKLNESGITVGNGSNPGFLLMGREPSAFKTILSVYSPTMDSINFWFLKKSVNLYGEAFVKAIAKKIKGNGSTDTGVAIIRDFWAAKGISKGAMNIIDGSGLAPANRISAEALARVLLYARNKSWYSHFYDALPVMNGIKMKDGYIGGVRSYAGYVKDRTGREYIFAIIVNNFSGDPGSVREKIWGVLDILK